jgi:predicted transcriptional regulator
VFIWGFTVCSEENEEQKSMNCALPSCYPKTRPVYHKILLLIYKNQMSTLDLALELGKEPQVMYNKIQRLRDAGLVERVKVDGVLQIRLTVKGRGMVEGME